jgi:hypothetical protein
VRTKLLLALFLVWPIAAQQLPKQITPSSTSIRGDVVVPATKADRQRMKAGAVVWKHVYKPLPPNQFNPKRISVWIDNLTHPGPTTQRSGIPEWLDYDPRKLRVTTRSISFDAPAGDHIFYVVGDR